jgi:hypothetical protein
MKWSKLWLESQIVSNSLWSRKPKGPRQDSQKKSLKIPKGQSEFCISKKNRQNNGQKDKQRSTKHTYKTKDRITRSPL